MPNTPPTPITELGARIQRLRLSTGCSAREFDKRAKVAVGLAAMLENGTRDAIQPQTAKRYAALVGCDWLWVYDGTGKPPRLKGRAA